MKKALVAVAFTMVMLNLPATESKSIKHIPAYRKLVNKTSVSKKMFKPLTVNFTLTCGTYNGAEYTCNGCSQETIDSDLTQYAAYYQNLFCGPGSATYEIVY